MIKEFENKYMKKYWELQTQQWCNYFENGDCNLSKIDADIYNISKVYQNKIQVTDRKSEFASLIINKDLVDKNPSVSELRNRIDDFDNYKISEDIKADRYKYRLALSHEMKDDVVKLINLRNTLSKEMGYNSYTELVLKYEELDGNNLINSLNKYLESNLPKAIEIIKKYNIKWETWFSDLNRISSINNKYNPLELVDKLLETLGFDEIKKKIQISFVDKGYSGCAAEVLPNDIRVIVEPINSLNNISTLFHEVGHAVTYSLNSENGLYKIIPPSCDEAMAVVMECIASSILLDETDKEKVFEIITLEYTRCAISALYEFELLENLDNAEELYIKHYSKLGFEIKEPSMWACDTFRSIDPVYIHNYVIGAILGEEIITYLQNMYSCNYKEWGNWLFENIYKDGRKVSFKDKIRMLCVNLI